jgi:transposase
MVDHWRMKAYSKESRQKVVQAFERGMPKSQVACLFGISLSSVKRYARLASQGESLIPTKGGERPPRADAAAKRYDALAVAQQGSGSHLPSPPC